MWGEIDPNRPQISTFHSFCARFLRRDLYRIEPYGLDYTIYDSIDSQEVVRLLNIQAVRLKDRDETIGRMRGANDRTDELRREGRDTIADQRLQLREARRKLDVHDEDLKIAAGKLFVRLDESGRPVFLYDLRAGEAVYRVSEQPVPKRGGDGLTLVRRFTVEGPAATVLEVAGYGAVTLDADGRAEFSLEVTW